VVLLPALPLIVITLPALGKCLSRVPHGPRGLFSRLRIDATPKPFELPTERLAERDPGHSASLST
jgi:hypothetical protein